MPSYESLFFEEIDGERRRCVLQGSEAPKGHVRAESAFHLGGRVLRARKQEIGVPRPTVHVNGQEERDLVIKVHLRDSLTGLAGNAEERQKFIDSFRERARPLRIVWGKTLRRGMLVETDFGVEGEGEYECELTFEIYDKGELAGRRARRRRPLALPSSYEAISDALGAARSAVKIPGISVDFSATLDGLFNLITWPLTGLLSLMDDVVSTVEGLRDNAAEIRKRLFRIAAHASSIMSRTRELYGFLISADDPSEDPLAGARWRLAQAAALEKLREVIAAARELGTAAEQKAIGSTSGRTYISVAGDTIEEIARRFDTTAVFLRALNAGLPIGIIPAGTRIRLP